MKGKKPIKKAITAFNMYFFARSLVCCNKYDENFRKYVGMLPDRFVFRFRVLPDGTSMTLVKRDGKLSASTRRDFTVKPDVDVCFKNLEGAFAFVTGRKSLAKCLAQSAFVIQGDVSGMMTVSHMFDIAGSYMLSDRILRKNDRVILPRTAGVAKVRFMTLFGRL